MPTNASSNNQNKPPLYLPVPFVSGLLVLYPTIYAALATVHPKPQTAAARGNCRPAMSSESTADVWCSVKWAWERCAQLNANARGGDWLVTWGFGEGKWKEGDKIYTFGILLGLLWRRVGVWIVNACRPAVRARVSGVGEVEDAGGRCGEDYVAGDALVFCCIDIEIDCWRGLFLEVWRG
jgi:hypothetical protein